jgi:hypothetical protein
MGYNGTQLKFKLLIHNIAKLPCNEKVLWRIDPLLSRDFVNSGRC